MDLFPELALNIGGSMQESRGLHLLLWWDSPIFDIVIIGYVIT